MKFYKYPQACPERPCRFEFFEGNKSVCCGGSSIGQAGPGKNGTPLCVEHFWYSVDMRSNRKSVEFFKEPRGKK